MEAIAASIHPFSCVPFRTSMKLRIAEDSAGIYAPAMSVPFYVAEDCAGLGTGFVSAQRTIRRLQRRIKLKCRKLKCRPWERAMKFQLKCRYLSESNPQLRAFFQNKHKNFTVKIVDSCAVGTADAGTKCWGQTACSTCTWQGQISHHSARWAKTKAVQMSAAKHCVMPFASSSSANRKPSYWSRCQTSSARPTKIC